MLTPTLRFYEQIKSKLTKESDLPNFFVFFLTIELGQDAATVTAVRRCYEDCDLHPPSWLGSHFSNGLRSKPRRFIRTKSGYRLENGLREKIAVQVASNGRGSVGTDLSSVENESPAGIEYHGIAGGSKDCQDAVVRLLQHGDQIQNARILSAGKKHCLLLAVNVGDLVAIKSGFSSGYDGEGPQTFSYVLQLLTEHGVEIDEIEVSAPLLERLDNASLTVADLQQIDAAKPVRSRWRNYVDQRDLEKGRSRTLWQEFPYVIPFAVIDDRIVDLAISFWEAPDDRLLKGYRRLEDLIRKRTGLTEHGAKLFSQAFISKDAKLTWPNIDEGEKTGRANLFTAAFMAHRNPRAHRELQAQQDSQLSEFLLLNHLYRLEREADTA